MHNGNSIKINLWYNVSHCEASGFSYQWKFKDRFLFMWDDFHHKYMSIRMNIMLFFYWYFKMKKSFTLWVLLPDDGIEYVNIVLHTFSMIIRYTMVERSETIHLFSLSTVWEIKKHYIIFFAFIIFGIAVAHSISHLTM